MKAQVLHGIGDIRFEDIADPSPKKGEVIVAVRACGICGSDVPRVFETGAHRMPLVIGHEFAGEVVKLGEAVRTDWIGKRVGVFPLLPCGRCPQCIARKYEMCENYNYLGSRCDGGFAEFVAVPEWNLFELPENVPFDAAAMGEPMAVAVHAIRRAGLLLPADAENADMPIVVCGLGTIGLLVVMFLADAGYRQVYALGNKAFQKEKAVAVGLLEQNYLESGALSLKDLAPAVFFDCVGKNEVLRNGIEAAAPSGCVVSLGNPASDMVFPKDCYWKILRKQLTIVGTWNSSFTREAEDDWHYVFSRLEKERVHPERIISHKLSLEKLADGLAIMKDKKEPYAKIMVM